MAAHDDKISTNRRRLFKALSAAPVVMTLRPGSALANASAYQCLVNEAGSPADFHLNPGDDPNLLSCDSGEPCYAYQEKPYWVVSEGTAAVTSDPATWPDAVKALLGATIVETQTDTFIALNGDIVDGGLLVFYEGGAKLRIVFGGITYIENIPTQNGLFLVLVEPLDGGTAIDIAGVYPEKMQGGDLQGIAGTCLASVHPGATGVVIARG